MTVQRFYLPYSEAAVEDLRHRLVRTRWPDQIPGSRWDYGVTLDYLKEICQYWKDEFDWKGQIEKMSAFRHYRYNQWNWRRPFAALVDEMDTYTSRTW
jgi:microsomal epoxide hydrolase